MITTCAFCNKAAPWATILVGIFAAFVYNSMVWFRIDDPLDAVAVHSGGGIVGLPANPFFIGTGGISDADSSNTCHFLHSQTEQQAEASGGVDLIKHGEHAYPAEAW